jgi:hypothetical protein
MFTAEDVSLAEEIVKAGAPDVGVASKFSFLNMSPVEQWAAVAQLLRERGYVVQKAGDASKAPDFGAISRSAMPKIRKLLSQIAPRNAKVTEEMLAQLRAEITRVFEEELIAAGFAERAAKEFARLLSMAVRFKEEKR